MYFVFLRVARGAPPSVETKVPFVVRGRFRFALRSRDGSGC
jgi:hypothetical protein